MHFVSSRYDTHGGSNYCASLWNLLNTFLSNAGTPEARPLLVCWGGSQPWGNEWYSESNVTHKEASCTCPVSGSISIKDTYRVMSLTTFIRATSHLLKQQGQPGRNVLVTVMSVNAARWNPLNRYYGVGSHMCDDDPVRALSLYIRHATPPLRLHSCLSMHATFAEIQSSSGNPIKITFDLWIWK